MNSSKFWAKSSPDLVTIPRIGVMLLALILAWQSPAPAIAQAAACGSNAVAVAPLTAANPMPDNAIELMDVSGTIGTAPVDQPQLVMPTSRPGTALVRSSGNAFALLDTATSTVIPVQIPADQQLMLSLNMSEYRNTEVSDFMLLPSGPDAVWLVDLRSGEVVDLVTLLPDGGFIDSASIAPGGAWVQYFSKDTAYLLPLTEPGDPIAIASDPVLPYPGFSQDGSTLLYATTGSGGVDVWSRDLGSGNVILTGHADTGMYFDPLASESVLLLDGQKLLAAPPGSSDFNEVFNWVGTPYGIFGDTSGRYLVVGDDRGDSNVWSWLDTTTGAVTPLDDLTGMTPSRFAARVDTLTFLPSPKQGPGTPGDSYRTLDLTTGQVATVLTQDSDEVWSFQAAGDLAGRYTLINAVGTDSGRMWLIDAEMGTAVLIGDYSGNLSARVSPDGCQLAVGVFDTVGEGRTSTVTVTSMEDGAVEFTAPDAWLLGWASTV